MPNTASQLFLLKDTFTVLIDSFIDNKVGIADNFLPVQLAYDLKDNLIKLYADKLLQHAGTGNDIIVAHNK